MKLSIFILFGVCTIQMCSTAAISEEVFNVQWEAYKNDFNKVYPSTEEEEIHKEIFKVNLEKINVHNEKYRNGEVSFEMGINQFTDLSPEEIKKILGFKVSLASFSEDNFNAEWEHFKQQFHKGYPTAEEEQLRKEIFRVNLEKINAHNEKYRNKEVTYAMEINQFADLTAEEFNKRLGLKTASNSINSEEAFNAEWENYKKQFDRKYQSVEEKLRKEIFRMKLEEINTHNEKYRKGEVTFEKGVNQFTDLTLEEFRIRLGFETEPHSEQIFKAEWEKFKKEFTKEYPSVEEEKLRKEIFRLKLEQINIHNEKYRKGEVTYEMGVNKFTDITTEEFKKTLGFKTIPAAISEEIFNTEWENFKNKFQKVYSSAEEEKLRKQIFRMTLEKINIHNEKYRNKEVSYEMGINNFSDYTAEEFKKMLGFKIEADTIEEEVFNVEWENYKNEFKKNYPSVEEEKLRREIFRMNLEKINIHNEKYRNKEVTFEMGINQFTDLTAEEFKKRSGGIISGYKKSFKVTSMKTNITQKSAVPDEVDWYKYGFQTEVINQAQCGSCYAQAVTGAIESLWYIKYGEFIRLSQQEIVDCSYQYGNMGCMYGDLKNTFTYIMENGVGPYDENPYQAQPSECRQNGKRYNITGFVQIKEEDEEDLKQAVAKGPVIAVISTGLVSFQYYKGGVYYDENCVIDPYSVNHFVLILGYGTNSDGDDYWLIKNSWGPNWGLAGYMYMARNRGNQCGIATEAMYPVL